jgi:putative membrane protein
MNTLGDRMEASRWGGWAGWFLKGSALVALTSVFGYKFFTLNPEFLSKFDWAMELYPYAYKVSAQAQILLGFCATVLLLVGQAKGRWVGAFLGIYGISLFSEFSGTSWGLPFGHYEYTDLLGFKIMGKVPWLIPTSWFFMGFASYRLALFMLGPAAESRLTSAVIMRSVLATAILVLWDVTLDPAMSHTTPFWVWEQPGSYYGMPAVNILGWALTGVLIMLVIEFSFGPRAMQRLSLPFFAALYGTNLILPLGLLAVVGAWPPIFMTIVLGWILFRVAKWLGGRSKFVRAQSASRSGPFMPSEASR